MFLLPRVFEGVNEPTLVTPANVQIPGQQLDSRHVQPSPQAHLPWPYYQANMRLIWLMTLIVCSIIAAAGVAQVISARPASHSPFLFVWNVPLRIVVFMGIICMVYNKSIEHWATYRADSLHKT